MPKHLTIFRCHPTTATIIIFATIFLFILIGCQALFRSTGLTNEQAALQTAKLKAATASAMAAAVADIQTGLAEGHDLKTIAVKTSSAFLWKMIAAAGASVGVVLNGLLAKWLSTEKKLTKVLITGIESNNSPTVKQLVKEKALLAGVESKLHARVKALT